MNGELSGLNGKSNLVRTIINGGGIGLTLVVIVLFYLVVSNHIAHNTEVLVEVREASRAQVGATQDLTETIGDLKFYLNRPTR